jgi:hypothetical protein
MPDDKERGYINMATEIIKTEYPQIDLNSLKELKDLRCIYHKKEDTLFIRPEKPSPAISVDWNGEIWIRVDINNSKIVGLEIEDFESIFLKKHPEIAMAWEGQKPSCDIKRTKVKKSDDFSEAFYRILYNFLMSLFNTYPQQLSLEASG